MAMPKPKAAEGQAGDIQQPRVAGVAHPEAESKPAVRGVRAGWHRDQCARGASPPPHRGLDIEG